MKSLRILAAALVAACVMTAAAVAADASGSWKWTQQGRGGSQDISAKLVDKDGKLTGTVMLPARGGGDPMAVEISDGTVAGDTVSFSIAREFNGNKFVTKYSGKLEGDTITGNSEAPGRNGGEPRKNEWVAKRDKM